MPCVYPSSGSDSRSRKHGNPSNDIAGSETQAIAPRLKLVPTLTSQKPDGRSANASSIEHQAQFTPGGFEDDFFLSDQIQDLPPLYASPNSPSSDPCMTPSNFMFSLDHDQNRFFSGGSSMSMAEDLTGKVICYMLATTCTDMQSSNKP